MLYGYGILKKKSILNGKIPNINIYSSDAETLLYTDLWTLK